VLKLLVIDLHNGGGHHSAYLGAVLREARRRHWDVRATLSAEAQRHSSFCGVKRTLEDGCELITVPCVHRQIHSRGGQWLDGQLHRFRSLRRAFTIACTSGRPDTVFILDCDSWYPAAALFGSPTRGTKFATIALRVRYHHVGSGIRTNDLSSVRACFQRTAFERFLRNRDLACVLTPDETLVNSYALPSSGRLRYLPDLAQLPKLVSAKEARRALGLPEGKQVVLSYGSLSRRKGIWELLNALSDKRCAQSVVALIAGEADAETTAVLQSQPAEALRKCGRLHWLTGFLDDAATRLAFSSADAAWLGYRDFYTSSGFLWQASLAGLPIIGCRNGLIGHLVERHQLGFTVNPSDHIEVLGAVDALMNDYRRRSQIIANCLHEGAKHLPSHFGAAICDELARCVPVGKGRVEQLTKVVSQRRAVIR
jgi:glycosyltransferase involved in cell wall biosynthesis